MRTALFFYVVAMHLIVFMTTYYWSHTGGCPSELDHHEHLAHLPPHLASAHVEQERPAAATVAQQQAAGGG